MADMNFGLIPSTGARLGYRDLETAGVVLPPPLENYNPTIHRASTTPNQMSVLPFDDQQPDPPEIFLVREEGAEQAYALMGKPEIVVGSNRHPDWGRVLFAVIYPASGPNRFQATRPEGAKYAAIKRLSKQILYDYLSLGGDENPYKEMARMEQLGENIHVLRHLEFLEDDDYLYIVTPKACKEGTLKDAIPWFNSMNGTVHFDIATIMDPGRSFAIFRKVLQILGFLERRGINHHDLKPSNFLFLTPDNLVVFDLALSVRLPVNPATGHRSIIAPQGVFGSIMWMDPKVFLNRQYDGVAMDLWAAGIILYNLLTNQSLYDRPTVSDIYYKIFVHMHLLTSQNLQQRVHAMNISRGRRHGITNRTTAHMNMSPQAKELLENLLRVHPASRYTLAEAMESAYVQAMDED